MVTTTKDIPIDTIDPPEWDIRKEMGEIEELKGDMSRRGLIQNIVVREKANGRYERIAGKRRVLAAKELGWTTIRAFVLPLTDRDAFEMSVAENVHKQQMTLDEEAFAFYWYVEVKKYGTQAQLAERLNKTGAYISYRIQYLNHPKKIKAMIKEHQLDFSTARPLAGMKTSDAEQVGEAAAKYDLREIDVQNVGKMIKAGTTTPEAIKTVVEFRDDFQPQWLQARKREKEPYNEAQLSADRIVLATSRTLRWFDDEMQQQSEEHKKVYTERLLPLLRSAQSMSMEIRNQIWGPPKD